MKKLFVASHTGADRIEVWLVVQAVDTADKKKLAKVKDDIREALSWRFPLEAKYDREHDINYGPFTDEYRLSEAAYRRIIRNFPDGDITPHDKWCDVLVDDLGITTGCGAHSLVIEKIREAEK
jgi:hypothetical protein